MKKISIIIPAYNEHDNLIELSSRLSSVFELNKNYEFDCLIIENGSTDDSWKLLKKICSKDKRFRSIQLSRNFRMDGALTAGLNNIDGDAAVLMAGDLQDPPELISEFIEKWEKGYDNIYQIVTERQGVNIIRRFNSQLFYIIANFLTGGMLPRNVSDFRLVDKKVYKSISSMNERNRFVRGLFAWSGFKCCGVECARHPRVKGESGAHTFKVLGLALKGIFAHSYIPLKLVSATGVFLSLSAFIFLIYFTIRVIIKGVPFDGFGTLTGIMVLMFGFLFIFLGIIGEYVGLIYEEVKQRPNFIVSDEINENKND